MYEFIPQGNKQSAKNIISALIIGGFAVMIVTSVADGMPFKWVFQTAGLVLLTVGIFLMTRYLYKSFIYRVEQTDEGADLTVIEIQKKSKITVCRISLSNVKEVQIFTAPDKTRETELVKSFNSDGRKKFNYCIDINPEKFVWILADECGERVAIKLNYDEKLCEIIDPAKSE